MPLAQVAFVWRHSRSRSFDGRFWSEMRDNHVIPRVAVLMAKNNEMIRHRIAGIRCFEPIAQLHCFAERSLCEMDMVNVGPFASSGRRGLLSACCELWRCLAVNKRRW